jgi:hypothetical protein
VVRGPLLPPSWVAWPDLILILDVVVVPLLPRWPDGQGLKQMVKLYFKTSNFKKVPAAIRPCLPVFCLQADWTHLSLLPPPSSLSLSDPGDLHEAAGVHQERGDEELQ